MTGYDPLEWWETDDDPMPETVETEADHDVESDLVIDDATGVIGRVER